MPSLPSAGIGASYEPISLAFLLAGLLRGGGADGYCDWLWGNGWVQLRVEAVSLLPLGLGQLLMLRRLQQFAQSQEQRPS